MLFYAEKLAMIVVLNTGAAGSSIRWFMRQSNEAIARQATDNYRPICWFSPKSPYC